MGAGLLLGWLCWLTVLSGYDIRQRRLPNWLTLPGALVAVLAGALAGHPTAAVAGAVALATVYLMVHLAAPAALGGGDVKLALGLGAVTGCFGAGVWFVAALAAPLLTCLCGLVALIWCGVRTVPHGPAMCLASVVAVLLAMPPPETATGFTTISVAP